MASGGQTINDRLNAVRYALGGQGLARTVCKATTEEVLGPKKKHIEYLIACTNEPNVSIPQLANLLIERTQHTSWAVVFKALTTIHHLMIFGNEKFNQYLATSNHSFELPDFIDRSTPQGYNMSNFVRRYAKYINDKSSSYRTLAIDLCKIKPGNDNALRTMNMDNLSKSLPILQAQFDSLLEFNVESKDLNNGIIMAAFRLLYKDLNKLYATYQEAIINLVERYFKLSRKKTREAFEMYKTFLNRMEKVDSFFKVVDQVGLDKSEMPDLTKFKTLLKLLEDHLAALEAKKRGKEISTSTQGAGNQQQPEAGESSSNKAEDSNAASRSSDKENLAPVSPTKSATSSSDEREPPKKEPEVKVNKKEPPPPKPARPSPKASPKSTQPDKSEAESSSSSGPETKKGPPPERPAKPPSRPPPPSASSPSDPQRRDSSPKRPPSSTGGGPPSRPAPPPHPPPPAHPAPPSSSQRRPSSGAPARPPASATSSTNSSVAVPKEQCNNHNQNGESSDSNNQSGLTQETPTAPAEPEAPTANSCSSTSSTTAQATNTNNQEADYHHSAPPDSNHKDNGHEPVVLSCAAMQATGSESASEQVEQEQEPGTNHVAEAAEDVEQAPPVEPEAEIAMPPPPPPIEPDEGIEAGQAAGELENNDH